VLISEVYASLQGEGLLTGTPSIFVRASGCNLRCWFCDTPYTSWEPEGEDWSVEQINDEVQRVRTEGRLPIRLEGCHDAIRDVVDTFDHVVVTGGEPMLFAELIPLTERLCAAGLHITIETAGTLYLPVSGNLMSISPKLPSSTPSAEQAGRWAKRHEHTRHQPEVIRRLTRDYEYQIKFVVDSPADLSEVDRWLDEFSYIDRRRVLLMPQGIETAKLAAIGGWLEPYCREHGLIVCPRKHIEWYGARRGT